MIFAIDDFSYSKSKPLGYLLDFIDPNNLLPHFASSIMSWTTSTHISFVNIWNEFTFGNLSTCLRERIVKITTHYEIFIHGATTITVNQNYRMTFFFVWKWKLLNYWFHCIYRLLPEVNQRTHYSEQYCSNLLIFVHNVNN